LKKSEQDSQINIVVEFESRVYDVMDQMLIDSLQEGIFLKCQCDFILTCKRRVELANDVHRNLRHSTYQRLGMSLNDFHDDQISQ
jgi:hypothetical protein